jgi:hypothetical protein
MSSASIPAQLATERFHEAITISREIKFQLGEAFALNYWGVIHSGHHCYQQATEHHHQASPSPETLVLTG